MDITVIIPYYNNSKTISRALASIQKQTYSPAEIIIVNDASSDWENGLCEIEKFNMLPLNLITHEINRNGSAARNTGIKNAKGEYIALLDADDEWAAHHLKSYVEMLNDDNKDALLYSRALIKKEGFSDLFMPTNGLGANNLSEYLFCDRGFISTSAFFIKTAIAKKVLFNENMVRHQDYDFLFTLIENNIPICFSDHCSIVVYWDNQEGLDKGGSIDFSLEWLERRKSGFTIRGHYGFILNQLVFTLLRRRDIVAAFKLFISEMSLSHVSMKEWYFLLSLVLFGRIKSPLK